MTPYPTYEPSGLPWLGDIPDHWNVWRGKRLFKRMNRPVQEDDEVVTAFRDGQVTLRRNRRLDGFTEAMKEIGYQRICKGDLVIHAMDAFAGAIGVSEADGKSTPVYAACRPIVDANPHFFAYLLRMMAHTKFILSLAKGIRERSTDFRFNDFGTLELPVPSPAEQAAIVAFLDRKGAEIDRFLSAKRRLIALLREQKAALITQAVTHGLNPHAPTKPSGVAWLGDVPAHWEMTPLKRITELQTGVTLGKIYTGPTLETRNYLRVANVQSGYFDLSDVKTIDLPRDEVCRYELQSDDVLVTEGGDPDKLGRGFVWEGQLKGCLHQNHIFCLRPHSNKLLSHYLALCLQSSHGKTYFMFTSKQTTNLASTNSTTLKQFMVPLPPPEEQTAIVAYIDREGAKIDKAIARTEREMELIHEYRVTLISEAVTGKWDVRQASQNAPHAAPTLTT